MINCKWVGSLTECEHAVLTPTGFGCKCQEYCAGQMPERTTSDNSKYAMALEVLREYINANGVQGKIIDVVKWMKERLNSTS